MHSQFGSSCWRHARRTRRTRLRVAATGIATAFAAACAAPPPPVVTPAPIVPANATIDEIARQPVAFDGRTVTVSGEVNRIFGPRWFSIGGEGFGGGEELLVVGRTTMPAIVNTLADSLSVGNDLVQVTGIIDTFDEDEIEDEIGVDLDGDWWRPYDAKPVLVMTDLDITPRVDQVVVSVPVVPVVTDVLVMPVPERVPLVGRATALAGVEVQTVTGPSTFWVGPRPDQRLFVVVRPDAARRTLLTTPFDIEAGQRIAVAGVLRAVPEDLSGIRAAWSLSAPNEAMLRRERVYLDATEVVVLDSATP